MTKWIDTYLRFADEQEAIEKLWSYRLPAEDGDTGDTWWLASNVHSLDPIGILYDTDGPLPGWHANLRTRYPTNSLSAYHVTPQNPKRVWA